MRYLGRSVGVLAFLVGMAAASPLAAQNSPEEVAAAYLAAWNAHDPDAAAMLLADDVVYLDVTVGEPQKGRAAARDNVIRVFMTAAPDLKRQMTGKPVLSDDGIAFEWTFGGTNTGAWGPDTPATGKSFRFDGVTLIHIANGKITYQGDYYDGLGFQKQLGWIE
jgi:steroid delta-isomerase-like uncharacterized protein